MRPEAQERSGLDHRHFDALTRALSAGNSRRRLVGVLATLPVGGGLTAILDPDDADAAGRRKRRKKRHKHGDDRRRKRKTKHKKKKPNHPTCTPDSRAQTCAGQCGAVPNNCGVVVDCGPCACEPACAACFICNAGETSPGTCVIDPAQQGKACGTPGQVCMPDGSCACDASSCPACTSCGGDGTCVPCADCCDGDGVCQPGETDAACGSSGTCEVCTGQEQCQGQSCVCLPACAGKDCGPDGCGGSCGSCTAPNTCGGSGTPGVCGCTPQSDATTCAGKCGSVLNNCGQTVDCTPLCTGCCTGEICQPGTDNLFCGRNGGACDRCTSPQTCGGGGSAGVCGCTPTCAGKDCGASDGCGGICTAGRCPTDQTCQPDGTCLQNLNQFQCLCGDNTTPSGCFRTRCSPGFDTVCSQLCTNHRGYYGFGTPGTSCGPGTCTA